MDTLLAANHITLDNYPLLIVLCDGKVKISFDSKIVQCIVKVLNIQKLLAAIH